MSRTLEFYFDFGSPTTYLANKRLQQLREQYDLHIEYIPILLGGIFKASGNSSPVTVPAKGSYMLQHDLPRFTKRYGVALNFNPHFPINTLNLMRGADFIGQMYDLAQSEDTSRFLRRAGENNPVARKIEITSVQYAGAL